MTNKFTVKGTTCILDSSLTDAFADHYSGGRQISHNDFESFIERIKEEVITGLNEHDSFFNISKRLSIKILSNLNVSYNIEEDTIFIVYEK